MGHEGKEHLKESPHFNLKILILKFLLPFVSMLFPFWMISHAKEKPHTMKVICSLAFFLKAKYQEEQKHQKIRWEGTFKWFKIYLLKQFYFTYGLALVKWLCLFHLNWLLYFLGIKEESLLEEEEYKMLQKKGYGSTPTSVTVKLFLLPLALLYASMWFTITNNILTDAKTMVMTYITIKSHGVTP